MELADLLLGHPPQVPAFSEPLPLMPCCDKFEPGVKLVYYAHGVHCWSCIKMNWLRENKAALNARNPGANQFLDHTRGHPATYGWSSASTSVTLQGMLLFAVTVISESSPLSLGFPLASSQLAQQSRKMRSKHFLDEIRGKSYEEFRISRAWSRKMK